MDNAEERVSKFYNTFGWNTEDNVTEDAKQSEDLRKNAQLYVSKCRKRVLRHIPKSGENILDMASGPIQYSEYLEYSKNFKYRYCIDLSLGAIEQAREKIGDHGVFLHGSFFDIPLNENFFDCSISLHTIYHIHKDKQEEAVRKLIRVTKPGKPVIIVYSNPNTIVSSVMSSFFFRTMRKIKRIIKKPKMEKRGEMQDLSLYIYRHPIEWWGRFEDIASVEILPWRSFNSKVQKKLIPDNNLGRKMLELLYHFEETFPHFFVKYFRYPMIIIKKK